MKVRRYAAYLINLNDYLDDLKVSKASDKIGETELNEILLKMMQSVWIKQEYMQSFYCENITKNMLIGLNACKLRTKLFYEGVVEPDYKKTTIANENRGGHSRQMRG